MTVANPCRSRIVHMRIIHFVKIGQRTRPTQDEETTMAGRWFEELIEGQTFDHEVRRTVTEADNMWFCNATYNPAPIHIDAEYCKGTEFGRPLMNSIFTLGLVIGLSVQETTLGTTVANLGMTDTAFPKP